MGQWAGVTWSRRGLSGPQLRGSLAHVTSELGTAPPVAGRPENPRKHGRESCVSLASWGARDWAQTSRVWSCSARQHLRCPAVGNFAHQPSPAAFPAGFQALPCTPADLLFALGRMLRCKWQLFRSTWFKKRRESYGLRNRKSSKVTLCLLVAQSCLTLGDLVDCSPPGSSVHGILQARILEWVAISLARGSSRPRDRTQVSCIAGRCFTL